ncbi:hypothetical protein [Pseudomonas rhizosphaerae]|uniref:hypothetical protein n=1 Tax=Pseudomonas rhizosphaerae TaxID=216142 RepID=UPI002B48F1DB|nr:hypothetical protein [Pseudomonas rhizosphaerae]MEB2870335.1 hypothetical protein [Pseudomonas rhizosphaerae]
MSSDKTREQFEAWAATRGMGMHLFRADSGLYVSRVTQNYMDCWMASRAAVVVELPRVYTQATRAAIEAADLQVKP